MSIRIAHLLGASLVGLAIIDEPDIRAGTPTSIGGSSFKHERDETLVADARKHAADWLALFERRCREGNVPASSLEVVGRPAASILTEMERHDLTVIGRDANFRFETESKDPRTLDTILHRAARPVLLVPEGAADTDLGKVVLIAYDGGMASKRALTSFAASGLGESREIHVATIDNDGEEAWEIASRGVAILRAAGLAANPRSVVTTLSNVDALNRLCEEIGAGLLVMGAFAHSRLASFFSGSVTHVLLESTSIPLYLQH